MTDSRNDSWASQGALALKVFATLSVLSVVAVMATHVPGDVHEMTGVAASGAASAQAPASSAATDSKPYYMPSEYDETKGVESAEPVPTF